jgi:hypothetical protein
MSRHRGHFLHCVNRRIRIAHANSQSCRYEERLGPSARLWLDKEVPMVETTLSKAVKAMDPELHSKQVRVRKLLVACPYGDPLPDCPASELRKIPIEERIRGIMYMSVDELDLLLARHARCVAQTIRSQ